MGSRQKYSILTSIHFRRKKNETKKAQLKKIVYGRFYPALDSKTGRLETVRAQISSWPLFQLDHWTPSSLFP